MKYQVNITYYENGATSEDYIRDCEANADQEWIELLESGRVSLEEVE